MINDYTHFAEEWIDSWNAHDLDRIMSHYRDDCEITTPMIKTALGIDTGTLAGKSAVRNYWRAALDKVPDLHFELIDITASVNSVALYYQSISNKKAIEVMFFDKSGKVSKGFAHYSE
ncbi:MAG TPA: nuclear transport factor 2 family protein [Spirochaetota bacterium]|nr:nuclear transport factor 2 family protein [Spirochaetota bacterium]